MSVASLGQLVVTLRGNVRPLQGAMRLATGVMRSSVQTIERYAKRGAIAAGAIGVMSVRSFAKFEKQLAEVSTMLDEQTMKHMPAYEKAVADMSVAFGQSTETLARGLYDILSASVAAEKAISVLNVAVKAGVGGISDAGVAADAITTILNAYQLEAKEAASVSDLLFAIVKKGKTTFGELAPSIGKVASISAIAGLSMEDMGAAIATMTRAGVRTDIAITALKSTINTFLKPQEDSVNMARNYGIAMNATTLQTIGLVGILKKLKNVSAEDLSVIMPNIRAITGFAAALKNATGMADDYQFMVNRSGLANKAFEKMSGTLDFALNRLKESIKKTATAIGRQLAPGVRELTRWITDNQDVIQYWAVYVTNRFLYVKDVLWGIAKWLKKDWKDAIGGIWSGMVEGFIAAGKIMIKAAVIIGKGIWQAIRDKTGPTTRAIYNQAEEVYKERHGKKPERLEQEKIVGGQKVRVPIEGGSDVRGSFYREYKKSQREEMKEIVKELSKIDLWADFKNETNKIIQDAMKNVGGKFPEAAGILEGAGAKLKERDAANKKPTDEIVKKTEEAIVGGHAMAAEREAVKEQLQEELAIHVELTDKQKQEQKAIQETLNLYKEEATWLGKIESAKADAIFKARELVQAMYPDDLVARDRLIDVYTSKMTGLVTLSKQMKEYIKTPKEKLEDFKEQIKAAVAAEMLTAEEAQKAIAKKTTEIGGGISEGSAISIGGSISARGLSMGGELNPMTQRQDKANTLLERIASNQETEERL